MSENERERELKEIYGYLIAAAEGCMSPNNSRNLADELLEYFNSSTCLLLKAQTNGWRPISEAPKDGTQIMMGHKNWPISWQGFWDTSGGRSGWQRFNSSGQGLLDPTHFQPLPKPPEETD